MTHSLLLSAFQDACNSSRCPFCILSERETTRYLATLLHEYTLAPDIHLHLVRSHGFCSRHAGLLTEIAEGQELGGLGVATLHENVLQGLREYLEELEHKVGIAHSHGRARGNPSPGHALEPSDTCLACTHEAADTRFFVSAFLEDAADGSGSGALKEAYAGSAGACMPHFRLLWQRCPDVPTRAWLVQMQRGFLAKLANQLKAYIESQDVGHGNTGPVARDVWERVVEAVSGSRLLAPELSVPMVSGKARSK